jgi:Holliday junction resolvase-like predicted endonuclease
LIGSPIAMLWLTRLVARSLGAASQLLAKKEPELLATARRGESEAYFHVRKQGYRIVAKNSRTPHNRGEIGLIGWDHGALCFVEVKTQAQPGLVPPEMAVDAAKKQHICRSRNVTCAVCLATIGPRAASTS